jgi:SAM-dependent methyltransferase
LRISGAVREHLTLLLAKLLECPSYGGGLPSGLSGCAQEKAENMGVADKISTLACSMDNLPFADEELDVIWSEGAIYHIGFEKGVADWQRYLKAGGLLVVSEITWITGSRPQELQDHWDSEYPEIDVASAKIRVLEKHGYSPIGYFVLPEHCWLDQYYRPMQASFEDFLNRNGNSEEARAIVAAEQREIDLYETYKAYISYGVYIAKKTKQLPLACNEQS